jgi:formylglycine-generating enzyme required for sulfatase activity
VDAEYSPDPDGPAVNVTWKDADKFCKRLSEREGVAYDLPTEAQWEYACRAGTNTRFSFGSNPERLAEFAWYNYTNGRASPVAMLQPNPWGIYDMHGNAWEWAWDWFSDAYYSECAAIGTVKDPKGPASGRTHVLRGGGWQVREVSNFSLTSTFRMPLPLFDRDPFDPDPVGLRRTIGFRIIRLP